MRVEVIKSNTSGLLFLGLRKVGQRRKCSFPFPLIVMRGFITTWFRLGKDRSSFGHFTRGFCRSRRKISSNNVFFSILASRVGSDLSIFVSTSGVFSYQSSSVSSLPLSEEVLDNEAEGEFSLRIFFLAFEEEVFSTEALRDIASLGEETNA